MLIGRYLVRFYTFESQKEGEVKVDNPNAGVVEPRFSHKNSLDETGFRTSQKQLRDIKLKLKKML